jgi:hypothetical protein
MIHEIDKDLVHPISYSYPQIPRHLLRILESASQICSISYLYYDPGQKWWIPVEL